MLVNNALSKEELRLEEKYGLSKCIKWIKQLQLLKVGIEFSENKEDGPMVSQSILKGTGIHSYILEDKNRSCGDCCVDERTSLPRGIDGIIHFGRACLTPTISMPVLYVFSQIQTFNEDEIYSKLIANDIPQEDNLILVYDLKYGIIINRLYEKLRKKFPHIELSHLKIPENSTAYFSNCQTQDGNLESKFIEFCLNECNKEDKKTVDFYHRSVSIPSCRTIEDYNFIYFGNNMSDLNTLQMRFAERTFYTFDSCGNNFKSSNGLKSVMSRSKKIENIKAAKIIGILATLISGHSEITSRLKTLIKRSEKKCYTFFLGRINEPKLGNVDSVDIFVYIACPQSSIIDRNVSSYIYQKIVAPWEVEVALNPNFEWSLKFEINFKEFLKEDRCLQRDEHQFCMEEKPKRPVDAIAIRPEGTLFPLHENAAGEVLQNLSWKGLDPGLEAPLPIGTVVQGKVGIASGYQTEIQDSTDNKKNP